MRLYELSDIWNEIMDMVESGATKEELQEKIDSCSIDIEQEAEWFGRSIRNTVAQCGMIKEEESRLSAKRKLLEVKAELLKQFAFTAMRLGEIKRLDTDLFSLVIKKNPPSVKFDDEDNFIAIAKIFYPDYIRTKTDTTIDKKKVLEFLKTGKLLEGVELFQGERLEIK